MKNSDLIPQLFFNYPSKYWHFEDVLKESGKSRAQTNEWLKKLQKTNLIKRVKPQKKCHIIFLNMNILIIEIPKPFLL